MLSDFFFLPTFVACITCLRSPPSHNPSPCFHIYVLCVAFAMRVSVFVVRRRSSLVTDALAVTARGSLDSVFAPALPCAHSFAP